MKRLLLLITLCVLLATIYDSKPEIEVSNETFEDFMNISNQYVAERAIDAIYYADSVTAIESYCDNMKGKVVKLSGRVVAVGEDKTYIDLGGKPYHDLVVDGVYEEDSDFEGYVLVRALHIGSLVLVRGEVIEEEDF